MRLHHWAKNALVFVPLVLGGKADDATAWGTVLIGFFALGFVVSATYIMNDIWDLPNDRNHRSKRYRPLASGDLSIRTGLLAAAASLVIGLTLAHYSGAPWAATGLATYVVVTLAYSYALKRVPILDVLVLAALFTFRLVYGILLADVQLSFWLLVFSMFMFLSLSLAKRHTDIVLLADEGLQRVQGRGYRLADGPLILSLGVSSAVAAIVVLVDYLLEDAFPRQFYSDPVWLWTIPPIVFLFLGRIWLAAQRGELHDDPIAFALKDPFSLWLGVLLILVLVVAVFGFVPLSRFAGADEGVTSWLLHHRITAR